MWCYLLGASTAIISGSVRSITGISGLSETAEENRELWLPYGSVYSEEQAELQAVISRVFLLMW
jgi:hypothetical protein